MNTKKGRRIKTKCQHKLDELLSNVTAEVMIHNYESEQQKRREEFFNGKHWDKPKGKIRMFLYIARPGEVLRVTTTDILEFKMNR